jgi:hypothetical protein
MSGAVVDLAKKYFSAAECSANEGNSVNMEYFLNEAIFFAEQADNADMLRRIETSIFYLLDTARHNDIAFCLGRAKAIMEGSEPDRMLESPRARILSAYSLAKEAQKNIQLIRDITEHAAWTKRSSELFNALKKTNLEKYLNSSIN